MSSVATFTAGAVVAITTFLATSAILHSQMESFEKDWCSYKATGVVREYDEDVCRQSGKNTCAYTETVHVVERQKLIVCQKLRWEK